MKDINFGELIFKTEKKYREMETIMRIKKLSILTLITCCACAPAMGMNLGKKVLYITSGVTATVGILYLGYTTLFYPTNQPVVIQPTQEKETAKEKLVRLQKHVKNLDACNAYTFDLEKFYTKNIPNIANLCKRFSSSITYTVEETDTRTFKTNLKKLIDLCAENETMYVNLITQLLKIFEKNNKTGENHAI